MSSTTKIGVGTFSANAKTRELVNRVLDTGRISYGPLSKELERRFADLHRSNFGVLSNSGTSSLQVALQALKLLNGWEDGDEVIVPAVTFVATANIVLHNRMKPVFVDVERDYYGIDPQKIEAAITPRTRAIIPVHLFGLPCEMRPIVGLANKHDLKIIEDSCETMFVGYHGSPVGTWGDVGCFSFYVAHLLTAGVGGIAVTDDPRLAEKMRSLVNHGRDGVYISIDDDDGKAKEVMSRRFSFTDVGHSFRITELEAAVALGQLDDWFEMIHARQFNANYLIKGLEPLQRDGRLQLPSVRDGATHAFMMFPIVLNHENKWGLCAHLESCGIETREMLPLINQPAYAPCVTPGQFPVAEWINNNGFYVGCHQGLTVNDLDAIIKAIKIYYEIHV